LGSTSELYGHQEVSSVQKEVFENGTHRILTFIPFEWKLAWTHLQEYILEAPRAFEGWRLAQSRQFWKPEYYLKSKRLTK